MAHSHQWVVVFNDAEYIEYQCRTCLESVVHYKDFDDH